MIIESGNLTQRQALENMAAIVNSDYFKEFVFLPSAIHSDILNINDFGRDISIEGTTVRDLSKTLTGAYQDISACGILEFSALAISLPEKRLRSFGFDERIFYDQFKPFTLPLTFTTQPFHNFYRLNVSMDRLNREYYQNLGINYQNMRKVIDPWHVQVKEQVNKVVPHKLSELS